MSNQHVLKIHPAPLADLLSGAKTAEVRRNDRGFQVGDTVRLMVVNPETGNWTGAADQVCTITHIQTGYGLPDDLCVLSYGKVGHDYKAHWMGFMDRTDWMQEKGQVPAKYLGQHRADILTDMLREAREALARVEAERAELWRQHREAAGELVLVQAVRAQIQEDRDTAQAQLAEAIKLLGWSKYQLMLWEDYQVENGFEVEDHYVTGKVREEVEAFLARHAQAEQQEAREPVLARTEHGVSMDEALDMTMDRYSGAMEKLAAIEQLEREVGPGARNGQIGYKQEAQGAQAGDEAKSFERWWTSTPILRKNKMMLAQEAWMARAALATQPASHAGDFQREDRYIVIKRKDLEAIERSGEASDLETHEAVRFLAEALDTLRPHLPAREYLVIESDWPEYEPTWAAIQARMTGQGAQAGDDVIALFERIISQSPADLDKATEDNPWYQVMASEVRAFASALATQPAAIPPEISLHLMGTIVDEVFDGGIEDASVISDIYRVIARESRSAQPVLEQLWAVHAQGPDDLYAAFSREDAEAFAAGLNALPCPPGISVSAVVIESPWPAAEHWKYLAEMWKDLADKEQESNSRPAAVRGAEHDH